MRILSPSAQQLKRISPTKLLVSEARSILYGHFLIYSHKKGHLGNLFLIKDVQEIQGKRFLVSGTIEGHHYEVTLTASAIVMLSKFREYEIEVGNQYVKYKLC